MPMKAVFQPGAGKTLAPYSPGAMADGVLYVSGTLALDKDTNVVHVGDAAKQTEFVLDQIKAVVETAGGTMADIVKMNVYLVAEVDPAEVPKFRAIRDRYVNTRTPPASTLVVVSRLARPGWLVEIEAIAALDD